MKKNRIVWKGRNDETKWFAITDVHSAVDGRDLILTKKGLDKIILKLLYWGLNECDSLMYVEMSDGEMRRMDNIVVNDLHGGRAYWSTVPLILVDSYTSKDRMVEFYQ